jgi:haloacid dehalogenase superfamily, subfamily IA, variant 3 with third motif having DD or ED/haloacid dehalogenase superfamily, subfamily IA, variant 1 with third motif having Dx(3-4)D or Dx(3-4)E
MIDTIVFDIGQVLVHFRWREYIEDFGFSKEVTDKLIHATVENIDHWSLHDKGVLSDEEFITLCIQREPDIKEEILLFFEQIEHIVKEFDYSAHLISQLRENGYKVYLLSNYGTTPYQYAKKNFLFLSDVDGEIISSHVKEIKPEPQIYQILMDTYHVDPQKAVFLDDRLDNIQAADKLGFHTIHFTGLDQALKELNNFQVNLEGLYR